MKTLRTPAVLAAMLASSLLFGACGKTKRSAVTGSPASPVVVQPSLPPPPVIVPPVVEPPSEPTGGLAPYSFEFTKLGSEAVITTPITTDIVLKVKFKVTTQQGNIVHQASELNVTLAVNGTEVQPNYTSNNYAYGRIGETS